MPVSKSAAQWLSNVTQNCGSGSVTSIRSVSGGVRSASGNSSCEDPLVKVDSCADSATCCSVSQWSVWSACLPAAPGDNSTSSGTVPAGSETTLCSSGISRRVRAVSAVGNPTGVPCNLIARAYGGSTSVADGANISTSGQPLVPMRETASCYISCDAPIPPSVLVPSIMMTPLPAAEVTATLTVSLTDPALDVKNAAAAAKKLGNGEIGLIVALVGAALLIAGAVIGFILRRRALQRRSLDQKSTIMDFRKYAVRNRGSDLDGIEEPLAEMEAAETRTPARARTITKSLPREFVADAELVSTAFATNARPLPTPPRAGPHVTPDFFDDVELTQGVFPAAALAGANAATPSFMQDFVRHASPYQDDDHGGDDGGSEADGSSLRSGSATHPEARILEDD